MYVPPINVSRSLQDGGRYKYFLFKYAFHLQIIIPTAERYHFWAYFNMWTLRFITVVLDSRNSMVRWLETAFSDWFIKIHSILLPLTALLNVHWIQQMKQKKLCDYYSKSSCSSFPYILPRESVETTCSPEFNTTSIIYWKSVKFRLKIRFSFPSVNTLEKIKKWKLLTQNDPRVSLYKYILSYHKRRQRSLIIGSQM